MTAPNADSVRCPGSGHSITNEMWDDAHETAECPSCGKRVRSHGFQAVLARHNADMDVYRARIKARQDHEALYARCVEDATDDIKTVLRWSPTTVEPVPEWHVNHYGQGSRLAVFFTSEAEADAYRDIKRKEWAKVLLATVEAVQNDGSGVAP